MADWLFKEEPGCYSFTDLERDGGTIWSGVTNAQAQIHLREIKKGDRILFYHTGNEKAVVGVARATSDAYPDPKDKSGKLSVVDVAPVQPLKRPVTLAEIKASKAFTTFPLTHLPRLSVMPVTEAEWKEIERMARS